MAADSPDNKPCRLIILDQDTKQQYLIDTGSDVSVYPRSKMSKRTLGTFLPLYAANGTIIPTYDKITLQPNLGLRRAFTWRFIVADVTQPIIGADFLAHFHLLPDMKHRKLLDAVTGLTAKGQCCRIEQQHIKTLRQDSPGYKLLAEFPQLTNPSGLKRKMPHTTRHYIETTPGPT